MDPDKDRPGDGPTPPPANLHSLFMASTQARTSPNDPSPKPLLDESDQQPLKILRRPERTTDSSPSLSSLLVEPATTPREAPPADTPAPGPDEHLAAIALPPHPQYSSPSGVSKETTIAPLPPIMSESGEAEAPSASKVLGPAEGTSAAMQSTQSPAAVQTDSAAPSSASKPKPEASFHSWPGKPEL